MVFPLLGIYVPPLTPTHLLAVCLWYTHISPLQLLSNLTSSVTPTLTLTIKLWLSLPMFPLCF